MNTPKAIIAIIITIIAAARCCLIRSLKSSSMTISLLYVWQKYGKVCKYPNESIIKLFKSYIYIV